MYLSWQWDVHILLGLCNVPDDDDNDGPSVPPQLDESSMLSDLEAGDMSVHELQYEIVGASSKSIRKKHYKQLLNIIVWLTNTSTNTLEKISLAQIITVFARIIMRESSDKPARIIHCGPRLFLRQAVKIADWLFYVGLYSDSCRKNSTAAIFTATIVLYIISEHHKRVYIELL